MKKYIAFLLSLVLAMSLSACSCAKQPSSEPTVVTNPTTAPTVATEATEPTAGNKKTLPGTMEDNINKIMEENPVEFMGGVIPIDLQDTTEDGLLALTGYTGLSSGTKLTDGAVYEPMMGSQAFSLVMVRTAEGADPKAVAEEMKNNIDPRKWICVGADEIMAAGYSDTVMFIMVDSQMGLHAQTYVDAFQQVAGAELDFTI